MRNIIHTVILFVFVFACVNAIADPLSPIKSTGTFEFTGTEIGQAHPFAKVQVTVTGRNLTGKPVEVERIVPRDPQGISVEFVPARIAADGTVSIKLDIVLSATVGRVAHYFDVFVKDAVDPIDGFVVRGFSDWLISPSGTEVDFGTFEVTKPVTRIIPIEVRPGTSIHLVGASKPSAYFDVKVVQGGMALELTSRKDAPWSSFDENLLVKTDNELQPMVAFHLRGQARGLVVPSSDPLDFGLLREGQTAELIIVLNDVSGDSLQVGSVTPRSRMKVDTAVAECTPANKSCKNIKVSYPPMNMLGMTGGVLEIELPAYKRDLYVRFGAIGIGKNTQIRSLEEDLKAAQEESKSISSVLQSSVTKTTEKAKAPATMSTPDGTGPLLKWQVTNEYDIYGYEIYRSVAETGPYSRVNDKILERLDGDPEAGSIYQWRDSSAESGNTYWYYINIVYNKGRKQQFTSPQKIVAK